MLFPKVNKISIHISTLHNTSLSKIAHSVTAVCVIGWIWGKTQVRLRSLALCTYEISRRTRIFPPICFRQWSA